jgi:hypothetical protein
MSTLKKTASSLASSVAAAADVVVRFSIGAAEVAAADAWRAAGAEEVGAAVRFYRVLFGSIADGGHEGDIAALLPFKDGAKRSNEQQAFFDFAQRLYLVYKCGADLAAVLKDANVKGDAMVQRPGVKADGSAYKPQAKRALRDSLLGKEWGAFVRRLVEIKDGAELSARIEAGEVKEGEGGGGAARSTKSDRERAIAKVNEAVKILRKDVEKADGSIAPDVAAKVAALLVDVMSANGLK